MIIRFVLVSALCACLASACAGDKSQPVASPTLSPPILGTPHVNTPTLRPTQIATPTSTPTPSPSATPVANPAFDYNALPLPDTRNWQIYTSQQFGFSLKYPIDWQITGDHVFSTTDGPGLGLEIRNSVLITAPSGPPRERFRPGAQKIDFAFTPLDLAVGETPSQFSIEIDGRPAEVWVAEANEAFNAVGLPIKVSVSPSAFVFCASVAGQPIDLAEIGVARAICESVRFD